MRRSFTSLATVVLAAGALFLLAGCNSGGKSSDKLKVVCTTGQVADLVEQIGGEHVEVVQLIKGESADPHVFKASPNDVSQLRSADVVFYHGLHLEADIARTLEELAKKKKVFAVAEILKSAEGHPLLHAEGDLHDPHVWHDAELWSKTVMNVAERLAEVDEKNADTYRKNAEAYRKKLVALHAEVKAEIAKIPTGQRTMVTGHDAFQYFGRAYGMKLKSIQGVSTAQQTSSAKVDELVKFLVDNKIKAVFGEKNIPNEKMAPLIEGCADEGLTVTLEKKLFSDGMPEGGKDRYERMMRHNLEAIVNALK